MLSGTFHVKMWRVSIKYPGRGVYTQGITGSGGLLSAVLKVNANDRGGKIKPGMPLKLE